jgi:hypothetical protein
MRLPITELLITDGMIDAHEAEWERWSVRLNKVPRMTTYEVIRGPAADEPISEETLKIIEDHPGDWEQAHYRMERLRIEAAIKAALSCREEK